MPDIYLSQFTPKPKLVVKKAEVLKPKFPVFDAHNHMRGSFGGWEEKPIHEILDAMAAAGVKAYVDLDGGWGEDILYKHLDNVKAKAPERFFMFGGVDWVKWAEHGDRFGEWAAERFRQQVARGAQGLKIWKPFGLQVRDQHGDLVTIDDPRLDPLFAAAGELGLPVLMHIADPVAFFDPQDANNERYEELNNHPDWHFPSPPYPPFMKLLTDFKSLVTRHKQTTFIGAHVGCYAENLGWVGQMLDDCPNFYVDISARVGELGRQPYSARRFFLQYTDRILFGIDAGIRLPRYRIYYRFLETDDEYFNYSETVIPRQGRWAVYGLYLPDDVLKKVYYENAERLFNVSIPPL